ncbi:unnamed protein product [Calypogeia fissa]
MAEGLSSGKVRVCRGGDCSTSDVTEQQEQEGGMGGISSVQVAKVKECEGFGVVATERCVALLLPKELSRRVFSQLDYRDLVQCSLVCKQWHLESAELRQGWKEELYWEACSIRGVHFSYNSTSPSFPHLHLYLAGSPD